METSQGQSVPDFASFHKNEIIARRQWLLWQLNGITENIQKDLKESNKREREIQSEITNTRKCIFVHLKNTFIALCWLRMVPVKATVYFREDEIPGRRD